MSIAENEASQKANAIDHFSYGNPEDAYWDGYVAGRTAPVTEAEIDAAAKELLRHDDYTVWDSDIRCDCGKKLHHTSFRRHQVAAMLSAARKQVSE